VPSRRSVPAHRRGHRAAWLSIRAHLPACHPRAGPHTRGCIPGSGRQRPAVPSIRLVLSFILLAYTGGPRSLVAGWWVSLQNGALERVDGRVPAGVRRTAGSAFSLMQTVTICGAGQRGRTQSGNNPRVYQRLRREARCCKLDVGCKVATLIGESYCKCCLVCKRCQGRVSM
jgi:hypothetical protein